MTAAKRGASFENARSGAGMRTGRALERHLQEHIVAGHVATVPRAPFVPSGRALDAPTGGRSGRRARTRRGSSRRGGAFGRLQNFGRQVFEISSRVLTFRPYVAREPIKFVTPVRVETSFLFRPGHRANWSERAAARSDAPLARVRVGLDDAGIPCIFARRWGHAVVAGKPAEEATRLLV